MNDPVHQKKRVTGEANRKDLLSEKRREELRTVISETVAHLQVDVFRVDPEAHYKQHLEFNDLLPFLQSMKTAADSRTRFWDGLHSFLGLDRKSVRKTLLALFLFLMFAVVYGPQKALAILGKLFGLGG